MQNLIVFVPGVMGSRLKQPPPGGTLLWHEGIYKTMSQLVKNPGLLKWTGTSLEPAGVLYKAKVLWKTYELCKRFREEMLLLESSSNYEYSEFSYDWREDLRDAARKLGEWLVRKHRFAADANGKQQAEAQPRLNVVTHSMGSLVAALAITEGFINPSNLRRLICVGAPFKGSPAAFRGLYTVGYLTGLKWLERAVNYRKDAPTCRKHLSETFQSFTSAYQLLPPAHISFVNAAPYGPVNPLTLPLMHAPYQSAAAYAHAQLANLESVLQAHAHLKGHYHFIYGESPKNTQERYTATVKHGTFENVKCVADTAGDGTVPSDSARLGKNDPARTPVAGVKHMSMFNDDAVVQLVKSYL